MIWIYRRSSRRFEEDIISYLHLLGTGAVATDPERTTTMIAVENRNSVIAVDCGGDLVQRLLQSHIDLDKLDAIVLTHGHPDHISGFALMMQRLWLYGRRRPLAVFGPAATIELAQRLWDIFQLEAEDGMPPIEWNEVGEHHENDTIRLDSWECWFTPASHGPDTIGLRFRDPADGSTVAYSSDSAPDPRISVLARNADILVHEATGDSPGHSSAVDAARIAKEANVHKLLLVHLPKRELLSPALIDEARAIFSSVELGEEGRTYRVEKGHP